MYSGMKSRIGSMSLPGSWGVKTSLPPDVPVEKESPSPDVQRMLDHLRERSDAPKIRLPGR